MKVKELVILLISVIYPVLFIIALIVVLVESYIDQSKFYSVRVWAFKSAGANPG